MIFFLICLTLFLTIFTFSYSPLKLEWGSWVLSTHFAHRLAHSSLMATSYRFMVLIFVVLLSTLHQFSSLSAADSFSSYRSLLAVQRNNNRIPRCNEMGSRSECLQNPKCKRCRSEALDDMCFSESEAWRLPHQVFTCDS